MLTFPFDTPIPDLTVARGKHGARQYPIDLDASENKEGAVDVCVNGILGENYYHKEKENPPYNHRAPSSIAELYVRKGILTRLTEVNELLRPLGYELFLFDAYRPIEVQNYFHDIWVPDFLRSRHPDWSEEHIFEEVGNYWAKGAPSAGEVDLFSPPGHATGGVVDCTLVYRDTRAPLFMGSDFDEVASISFPDHFEHEEQSRALTPREAEARNNRRILYHAMTHVGFVVNTREWWHFSYGDQAWALRTGASRAVYSLLTISHD